MAGFNRVTLFGRLTRDPDMKETPMGTKVVKFDLAVDRGFGDDKKTDFFPCVGWRGTAENIAKYFKKGDPIIVGGQLQNRQWEDNKGSKHTTTDVMVTEFAFCGAKESSSTTSSTPQQMSISTPKGRPTLQPMDDDDDIPF